MLLKCFWNIFAYAHTLVLSLALARETSLFRDQHWRRHVMGKSDKHKWLLSALPFFSPCTQGLGNIKVGWTEGMQELEDDEACYTMRSSGHSMTHVLTTSLQDGYMPKSSQRDWSTFRQAALTALQVTNRGQTMAWKWKVDMGEGIRVAHEEDVAYMIKIHCIQVWNNQLYMKDILQKEHWSRLLGTYGRQLFLWGASYVSYQNNEKEDRN